MLSNCFFATLSHQSRIASALTRIVVQVWNCRGMDNGVLDWNGPTLLDIASGKAGKKLLLLLAALAKFRQCVSKWHDTDLDSPLSNLSIRAMRVHAQYLVRNQLSRK